MRLVLYVNADRYTLYRVDRHGAHRLGNFLVGQAGRHRLHDMLVQLQQQPVSILVDLIEEEFRHDTIPHVRGNDRTRMLERHAAKLYRGTPFRYSQIIGRLREGRCDDKVLFSALTNPDNLQPLLDLLEETATPLAGIFSLPIVSTRLLKPLQACSENVLLITEQPDGGLRETFLRGSKIQFSRLAPIQESSPDEYCSLLDAEVNKTQRYLNTLRLLAPGESVDVYPIADGQRCDAVKRTCPDTGQLNFHPTDIRDLAIATGFKSFPETGGCDALFAFLLGNTPSKNHYAQAPHLKRLRGWQGALMLKAASWLLAVIGLSWSGINTIDGWMAHREGDQVAASRSLIAGRYTQLTRELPVQPEQARAMREAAELADSLERHTLKTGAIFKLVGSAFSHHPTLELRQLSCFTSDKTSAHKAVTLASMDASASLPLPHYTVTLVSGRLRHFNGSYQHAQEQVDALADWLRQQPGVVSVNIDHAPLDTRPDSQIQGELDNKSSQEKATFELRIVMEMTHGEA